MSSGRGSLSDDFDSIINVIGLSPNDPLEGFGEMWYQVFLWSLFSSIFVHTIAAAIGFCRLRKHRLGRWMAVGILAMGFLSPLFGGTITSAAVAGVYRAANVEMKPFYALVLGVGQTIVLIFVSFTRILVTL